ncbi:ATP-grasp domain-containing protein [Ekhidna sp. To15]|uniref:ATP-grasp domain-containing protein n=1 Tax=Ekhidna sp. To15 TaxID=3395267 RepID=UPI003F522B1C
MSKTILVTGIGGVVGQGILKNIKREYSEIRLIGTNTLSVSAGNHLCTEVYKVPLGDDASYMERIVRIVEKENVDLIIPSTDLESYHLGTQRDLLPENVELAISDPSVTGLSLDKWKTSEALETSNIPFAKSFLPSQYKGQFSKTILKPRTGRGSRDIYVNPENPSGFDDTFIVQELLEGPEITTTFYVTKNRAVKGQITFVRELDSGNTSKAEVTFEYEEELQKIIDKFIESFDCVGSINIQSKVTAKGIIPFEINSRISGTNSLRPHFGFPDVKFTVQEWLFNQKPEAHTVTSGCALRVIDDIIYSDIALSEIKNDKDNFELR